MWKIINHKNQKIVIFHPNNEKSFELSKIVTLDESPFSIKKVMKLKL